MPAHLYRQALLLALVMLWPACAFRTAAPLDGGVSLITCADPSECPRGLACSAALGRCYDPSAITIDAGVSGLPCESRFDCPRPLTCASDFGFCVQADEVPVDAEGSTPLTCTSRTGCPAPLACALALGRCVSVPAIQTDGGLSALPCNSTTDCVGTLVCAAGVHRCADPAGLVVDGGVSVLPCTTSADCIGSLVCANGLRRCADPSGLLLDGGLSVLPCSTTADCIGTLVCANGLRRCADPGGLLLDAGVSVLPCSTTSDCIGTLVCARGLGACTNVEALPLDDAGVSRVPCQFTDDCPTPLACSTRAGLCVDTTRSQLPVIRSARLVDATGQVVTRRSGVAPFDTGQVVVELQLPPVSLSARFRTTETTCSPVTPTSWVCPLTFSGPSGSELITLLASDLRGVAATERLSVTIDADSPRVIPGTEVVSIVPSASNPLVSLGPTFAPTAARLDSTVRVTLLLDDPNAISANLFLGAGMAQLPFVTRVGQSFVFEGTLPMSLPDGAITLELTALDDVGNRSARTGLAAQLRKDSTPPPTPNVTTDDGVIVERVPLGDGTRSGAFVRMRLSPAATLLVFREAIGAPPVLALRGTGAAIAGQVSVGDQEQLTVQALDEAGNASSEVQVRRFRLFVHPGRAANLTHVATTPDLLAFPARADPTLPMPLLEAADRQSLQVQPVARWELLHDALDAGSPSGLSFVSLVEDTPRQRLLRIVTDGFGSMVTDLANGRHVVTNLRFGHARYEAACHTSERVCLLVGTPENGAPTLWVLDDAGARQLRVLSAGRASITFDARREVFLLAQGSTLMTLDATGATRSTGTSDCVGTTACSIIATPSGVLTASSFSALLWRLRDGGTANQPGSAGPDVHLALERSTLEPALIDPSVTLLRVDGGTAVISPLQCSTPRVCDAAWDPLARTLTIISRMERTLLLRDGGTRTLDVSPDGEPLASWAIAESGGFILPASGRWRYRDRDGWSWNPFTPSLCGTSTLNVVPLGVAVDGGWVSPCGRRTNLTTVDAPVVGFPPFASWTVTLGNGFITSMNVWRDGQLFPYFGRGSSEALALPPNRVLTDFNWSSEVLTDGGVVTDIVVLTGSRPAAPGFIVNFSPAATAPPFSLWMLTGGSGMPTTFTRLTLTGSPLSGEFTPVALAPDAPAHRMTPVVVPQSGGRFLLYGGRVPTSSSSVWLNDVWALHTQVRPTVHWSVDTARFNVPLDGVLSVQVSTTLEATDAGIPNTEVLVWDPWRTSWQLVAALDGGATGSGVFVPSASTFDVAVSRLPTGHDPLEVDRLEAVIDYRR